MQAWARHRCQATAAPSRALRDDIHIFWWQACGKAFENRSKQLIYIVFRFSRQSRASADETPFGVPEDIHIFWWQACAEPLEKSLKCLIRKRISNTRQAAAASTTGLSTSAGAAPAGQICTYFVSKTVENLLTSHSST